MKVWSVINEVPFEIVGLLRYAALCYSMWDGDGFFIFCFWKHGNDGLCGRQKP